MKKMCFNLFIFFLFVSGSVFGMEEQVTIDNVTYNYYSVEMSPHHTFRIIAPVSFSVEEKDLIQKICLSTTQNDYYKIKQSDFTIVKTIMEKKNQLLIEVDAKNKEYAKSREVKDDNNVLVKVTPMSLMRVRPEYNGTVVDTALDCFSCGSSVFMYFVMTDTLTNVVRAVTSRYIIGDISRNYIAGNIVTGTGTFVMNSASHFFFCLMVVPHLIRCNSYIKTKEDNFEEDNFEEDNFEENIRCFFVNYSHLVVNVSIITMMSLIIKICSDSSYYKLYYMAQAIRGVMGLVIIHQNMNDFSKAVSQGYKIDELREQKRESSYYGRYMAGGIALSCCALIYFCLRK